MFNLSFKMISSTLILYTLLVLTTNFEWAISTNDQKVDLNQTSPIVIQNICTDAPRAQLWLIEKQNDQNNVLMFKSGEQSGCQSTNFVIYQPTKYNIKASNYGGSQISVFGTKYGRDQSEYGGSITALWVFVILEFVLIIGIIGVAVIFLRRSRQNEVKNPLVQ